MLLSYSDLVTIQAALSSEYRRALQEQYRIAYYCESLRLLNDRVREELRIQDAEESKNARAAAAPDSPRPVAGPVRGVPPGVNDLSARTGYLCPVPGGDGE